MKFLILLISLTLSVDCWKHKYGNDFVTYSIGERFDKGSSGSDSCAKISSVFLTSFSGDFLIRNETVESKIVLYQWPRMHRLEYKIQNHDDLLSFAQIDIIDTDVGRKMFTWKFMARSIFFFRFRIRMRFTSTPNQIIMKFWWWAPRSFVDLWKFTIRHRKTSITSRNFSRPFSLSTLEAIINFKAIEPFPPGQTS